MLIINEEQGEEKEKKKKKKSGKSRKGEKMETWKRQKSQGKIVGLDYYTVAFNLVAWKLLCVNVEKLGSHCRLILAWNERRNNIV